MASAFREFLDMRPSGGFKVILADPPWMFENWSPAGEGKNPSQHYGCMAPEVIGAIPVEALAAENCALFLWCTWPTIFQAEFVMTRWGFRYSGLAWEWIKFNPDTGKYAFGPGYVTRKNMEPCLLAVRGAPKPLRHDVRDFLMAPRREHSRKPDEQYSRIESLFPGPYLELFARQRRRGWKSWGREVDKFEAEVA